MREQLRGSMSTTPMRRDYSSLGCSGSTSATPCAATTRLRPHALYVELAVRRDYSSPAARALHRPRRAPQLLVSGCTRSTSTLPCASTTRLRLHALYVKLVMHLDYSSPAARALRQPCRAPRLSSPLSRLQRSTSPPPRVRVPRHVARLVMRLVAPLVVDYPTSRRLVVDHFAYAARPGASARRVARHTAHRRLLRAPRLRLAATLALLQPRRAS
jgi:hypothetical protein